MSEPEGAAVWARSGDDAIINATMHLLIQRLARADIEIFRDCDLRILVNRRADAQKKSPQCG